MQNGGKNSQNGRSRISSAAEANRENLNSEAEYERTHAAELAKENARLRKTIEDMHMQLSQNDGLYNDYGALLAYVLPIKR